MKGADVHSEVLAIKARDLNMVGFLVISSNKESDDYIMFERTALEIRV